MSAPRIRLATLDDASAVAAIYAPAVAGSTVSFEVDPPDGIAMAARIDRVQAYAPWLVAERNGQVVGYAYLARHHERVAYQWSADVAVYVAPGWQGQGVGGALYTPLLRLAGQLGYAAVHAAITGTNQASIRFHERFGFRHVALFPRVGFKSGQWLDVGWWQLELRDRNAAPGAPPRTLHALLQEEPDALLRATTA